MGPRLRVVPKESLGTRRKNEDKIMRKQYVIRSIILIIIFSLFIFTACAPAQRQEPVAVVSSNLAKQIGLQKVSSIDPAIQAEKDEIYELIAYAVVLKNWQEDGVEPQRGYNIGSVLVNDKGEVVFWARNANMITGNGTQHGEVRLIRNYLDKVKTFDLKGHIVYTTLEPCAMCSGMMVMTNIARTVYGQTDPDFGKALERLSLDTRGIPNGFKPYPRPVISEPVQSIIRQRLESAYKNYQDSGGKGITKWLRSSEAKAIYQDALKMFLNYKVKYPENAAILEKAQKFYADVPSDASP